MVVVRAEVEDALDEVLAEHFRVLLQQQVEQAVFTQAGTGNRRRLGWIIFWISLGAKSNIRSELCVLAHLFMCKAWRDHTHVAGNTV